MMSTTFVEIDLCTAARLHETLLDRLGLNHQNGLDNENYVTVR